MAWRHEGLGLHGSPRGRLRIWGDGQTPPLFTHFL